MNSTANLTPAPRKRQNLAQGLIAAIAGQLRDGSIKPGDKLPTEAEIMRLHGVSRTVVREAISHMQAAAMVETRHGIGTFALEPASSKHMGLDPSTVVTIRDVLAIMELRISLETEAAGLAAGRRSAAQVEQLRAALDHFQLSCTNAGDTVAADVQFHLLIAQASGNRYFYDILSHLGTNIIPRSRVNSARFAHDAPDAYQERVNREHEDIFNAISRQDPESARAAMRTHLSNSRERLRKVQEATDADIN